MEVESLVTVSGNGNGNSVYGLGEKFGINRDAAW